MCTFNLRLMLQTFERLANKRLPATSAAVLARYASAAVGQVTMKGKKAAAAAAASLPTAVARPFAGLVVSFLSFFLSFVPARGTLGLVCCIKLRLATLRLISCRLVCTNCTIF